MPLHVTVILRCKLSEALPHLDAHFQGAKTKQVGRFLAVQHPDFDKMGVLGVKAVCVARGLPMRAVNKKEAIGG